jgi:hypothetical protein
MKFIALCLLLITSSFSDVLIPIHLHLNHIDIVAEGVILESEIVSKKSVGNDLVNDQEYIVLLRENLEELGYSDSLKDAYISKKSVDSSAIHKITIKVNKFYKGFEEISKFELTYNVRRFAVYSENTQELYIRDWSKLKVGDNGIFLINNNDNRKSFEGMIPSDEKECIDVINLFFKDEEYFKEKDLNCRCYNQNIVY